MLDSFLIGTVAKSPSMSGFNLTTKVQGKTVTLYVRKRHCSESFGDGQALPEALDSLSRHSPRSIGRS